MDPAVQFPPDIEAFLGTLPMPEDTSKWDAIFLCEPDFGLLLAWFATVFIHPDGELHGWWTCA